MKTEIKLTGGARIGWVDASYPFARLTVSAQQLSLSGLLGSYSFSPDQVTALQTYGWLLSNGIQIVHTNPNYPEKMVFLTWRNSSRLIDEIQNLGFHPSASPESVPARDGIPFRWSFLTVVVVIWNALFLLRSRGYAKSGLLAFLAIALLFLASVAVDRFPRFQSVALRPGHHVTEIRAFLLLMQIVSGFLLLGFAIRYFAL